MIVDTLMIILVYDTWLYDDKKKSYSMSETGENSATQGEVRQNKVRPQWVKKCHPLYASEQLKLQPGKHIIAFWIERNNDVKWYLGQG